MDDQDDKWLALANGILKADVPFRHDARDYYQKNACVL